MRGKVRDWASGKIGVGYWARECMWENLCETVGERVGAGMDKWGNKLHAAVI